MGWVSIAQMASSSETSMAVSQKQCLWPQVSRPGVKVSPHA